MTARQSGAIKSQSSHCHSWRGQWSFWNRFGFFVKGISTCVLFNAKAILVEEQQIYYLTSYWGHNRVHTFSKGISPKVNAMARLEFQLDYNVITVQYVSHYATEILWLSLRNVKKSAGLFSQPHPVSEITEVTFRELCTK